MLKFEGQGCCSMVKMDCDITFSTGKWSQELYRLEKSYENINNVK